MKRLFIDTETGGTDPEKHSLLSVGFAIWEDGRVYCDTEYKLKHATYNVTAEALAINGIDLVEHGKTALDLPTFGSFVHDFLLRHLGAEKAWLAGHNPAFDRAFLFATLPKLKDRFHYRLLDTSSLLTFLIDSGSIDLESNGLEEALDYFNIGKGQFHSAGNDAKVTAQLYTRLILIQRLGIPVKKKVA